MVKHGIIKLIEHSEATVEDWDDYYNDEGHEAHLAFATYNDDGCQKNVESMKSNMEILDEDEAAMMNTMIDEYVYSTTSSMSEEEMESILMGRLYECSESSGSLEVNSENKADCNTVISQEDNISTNEEQNEKFMREIVESKNKDEHLKEEGQMGEESLLWSSNRVIDAEQHHIQLEKMKIGGTTPMTKELNHDFATKMSHTCSPEEEARNSTKQLELAKLPYFTAINLNDGYFTEQELRQLLEEKKRQEIMDKFISIIYNKNLELNMSNGERKEGISYTTKKQEDMDFITKNEMMLIFISHLSFTKAFKNQPETCVDLDIAYEFWSRYWEDTRIPTWEELPMKFNSKEFMEANRCEEVICEKRLSKIKSQRTKIAAKNQRQIKFSLVAKKRKRRKKNKGTGNFPTTNKLKRHKSKYKIKKILSSPQQEKTHKDLIENVFSNNDDYGYAATHDANKLDKTAYG